MRACCSLLARSDADNDDDDDDDDDDNDDNGNEGDNKGAVSAANCRGTMVSAKITHTNELTDAT